MLHAVARSEAEARGDRPGPFWDVIEGRREPLPAAVLPGWQLESVEPDADAAPAKTIGPIER
jgi:hypothetical protein